MILMARSHKNRNNAALQSQRREFCRPSSWWQWVQGAALLTLLSNFIWTYGEYIRTKSLLYYIDQNDIPMYYSILNSSGSGSSAVSSLVDVSLWTRNEKSIQKQKDDMHNSSVAVLDLLPWEVQSVLQPNGACQVPEGVDDICCLGTKASHKVLRDRYLCNHVTLSEYQQIRQDIIQDQRSQQTANPRQNNVPACDVCRMVNLLRDRNWTFAFLGDSMMHQVQRGFKCELQRRQYKVTTETLPIRKGDGHRHFKLHERLVISSPLWDENDIGKPSKVAVDFMFQYNLPFIHKVEQNIVLTQFDILVINFGLHWNYYKPVKPSKVDNYWNKDSYGPMLATFFQQVREAGRVQLFMHRESSATHFDAAGGDYSLARLQYGDQLFEKQKCVPIVDNMTAYPSGWRERAVRQSALDSNLSVVVAGSTMPPSRPRESSSAPPSADELVIIPYFDFTSRYWKQHPRYFDFQEISLDCLHFCASPFIYHPIWTSIRQTMDRHDLASSL